jgi:hypothetical protein
MRATVWWGGFGCVPAPSDGILLLGVMWMYVVPVVAAVTFVVLALFWAAIPRGTDDPLPVACVRHVGDLVVPVSSGRLLGGLLRAFRSNEATTTGPDPWH